MTTTSTTPPSPRIDETQAVRHEHDRIRRSWRSTLLKVAELAVLAAIAYAPLLSVRRGVVTSDTKTYLYLDPGRFLSQVASMWDPSVALGTVTHEYIGYLFPMGPFFWLFSALHVPVWIAQRLWLGSILFAAGAGVLYLSKVLGLPRPGRDVAALAFMLSPYFLQYAGRISVILLPWAGLPWMVALAALSLRRGGWKHPALLALVVATVSGINASSVLYVAVAPALWLVYAVAVEHEATWRSAAATALKVSVLTLGCCLWWIVGLAVEAGYGVDVLRYTETVPATSQTSSAAEVIRGLGYWYFYGNDRLSVWTESAVIFTQRIWLLAVSYAVPVLAFFSAVFARWRYRAYFILIVVAGMVLSVGAHPIDDPTPVGGLLKAFMTDTTAGLAMRSTDRATPLVVLGLAMLLGAGAGAIANRLPRIGIVAAVALSALVVADNPAIFNGDAEVSSFFTQPSTLPSYQMEAIDHLNATHPGTRVFAIPGNDFAAYRWGDTVDTPQPAYLDRPFVTREQQVMGSMATADTLYAIDEPMQEDTLDTAAIAPMARLLSAGDLLVEYDQAYEHYGTPQPDLFALNFQPTPIGLSDPVSYGKPRPNTPAFPTLDEQTLASPPNPPLPSPEVSYTVEDPRPITRAESDSGALIVAGDATGLENMATTGLLDTDSAIYYAGTLDKDPARIRQLMSSGATLVVTDTNRKQAFRWDTLAANTGATETPSQNPQKTDPSDSPIQLFPGTGTSAQTIASYLGIASVDASSYGNAVSYTPEDRAYNAVDGNFDTNWETGTFVPDPKGQWWQIKTLSPIKPEHVTLVQPVTGDLSRWITKVRLTFDGKSPMDVTLGPSSRTTAGQVIPIGQRSFKTLRITIESTSDNHASTSDAAAVGFSEVAIPGIQATEVIDMPTDLLQNAGTASLANRLVLLMTRERVSPFPPRDDPETTITREFSLPTARTFRLSGTASISPLIPDDEIDRLVGRSGAAADGIVAYSEGRLPGDLRAGAASAIDGNPSTAWEPGLGASHVLGSWMQFDLSQFVTFDHLNLQVIADGRHSVPTSITIDNEDGTTRTVNLPPIKDGTVAGSITTVPVSFPSISGSHFRFTISGARLEYSPNYTSRQPLALPVGIAELGIPGVTIPPVPSALPGDCQSNLISIDGKPVDVRIVGSTAAALENGEMSVVPCGPDSNGITLSAGTHILSTAVGHTVSTGWNVDQLALDSAPGGAAAPPAGIPVQSPATGQPIGGPAPLAAPTPGPAPSAVVLAQGTTTEKVRITDAKNSFELVLGESVNAGWKAVAEPAPGAAPGSRPVNLGTPQLVDAFANGWHLDSSQLAALGATGKGGTGTFYVDLDWAPQKKVWAALAVSGVSVLVCLGIVVWSTVRRRRRRPRHGRDSARESAHESDGQSVGGPVPAANHVARPPTLTWPGIRASRRPRLWTIPLIAVGAGAVAAAIASPKVGVAAAAVTLVVLAVPRLRAASSLIGLGFMVAAAVLVVHGQVIHPVAMSADWPSAYEDAGTLTWVAVVFLGVDAVTEKSLQPD